MTEDADVPMSTKVAEGVARGLVSLDDIKAAWKAGRDDIMPEPGKRGVQRRYRPGTDFYIVVGRRSPDGAKCVMATGRGRVEASR